MRPESPTPRRSYGAKRSPWTTWIVLGGTLAVGAVLLVTMRAMFQVGNDMVRSVNESRLPQQKRGVRTAESKLAELEQAARAAQTESAREALSTQRLHGRVVFPEGTPEGEVAWVELSVPPSTTTPQLRERAHVRADGVFAFVTGELAAEGTIMLDAPHLYLASEVQVAPHDVQSELVLRPKVGAHVLGQCACPPGREDVRAAIVGADLSLIAGLGDGSRRTARVGKDLRFELRGVDSGVREWRIHSALLPGIEPEVLVAEELQPGATLHLDVQVRLGRQVAGRVVDSAGAPVAGAALILDVVSGNWGIRSSQVRWNRGPGRDQTDAEGRFELASLPEGEFELRAKAPGFLDGVLHVSELAEQERREGLVLQLGKPRAIVGRVVWPDGTPASGASVAVDPVTGAPEALRVAFADEEGAFSFEGLIEGAYDVSARVRLAEDVDEDGNVVPARSGVAFARAVASDTSALELRLGAGSVLRGRVVDGDGAPCAQFELRAVPVIGGEALALPAREVQGAFHSDDGRFELAGLHPGTWELRAAFGVYRSPGERVEVRETGADVELVLETKPMLAGVVRDESGAPVGRARVTFIPLEEVDGLPSYRRGGGETWTDGAGRFQFLEIEPGRIELHAVGLRQGAALPRTIDVPRRGRVAEVEFVLHPPARFGCTIVDEQGAPIPDAKVELSSSAGYREGARTYSGRTNDAGQVAFIGIRPDHYRVLARAAGRLEFQRALDVPGPDAEALRIELLRGAQLIARFTGSSEDRERLEVELFDARGQRAYLSDDGTPRPPDDVVLAGIGALGTYRVVLRCADGRETSREVVLSSFETVTIELGFDR